MENVQELFARRLPEGLAHYLPSSVTLCVDVAVEAEITEFIEQAADHLAKEIEVRVQRCERMVELGFFEQAEIQSFLCTHRNAQPWLLYCSENGGLGEYDEMGYEKQSDFGLIPCFHMPNHGVAWSKSRVGGVSMWLATARKAGKAWDWDSDIGHESCHSAFSPVPLFTLPANQINRSMPLSAVRSMGELLPRHISSICYMCSELSVVTIRGERRETATGLPALEVDADFGAFLALAHELMPEFGFDRALRVFTGADGVINPNEGEEIFEIGAPAIRAIPFLLPNFNKFSQPSPSWFERFKKEEAQVQS